METDMVLPNLGIKTYKKRMSYHGTIVAFAGEVGLTVSPNSIIDIYYSLKHGAYRIFELWITGNRVQAMNHINASEGIFNDAGSLIKWLKAQYKTSNIQSMSVDQSAIWQALGRVASLLEASLDDVHNF